MSDGTVASHECGVLIVDEDEDVRELLGVALSSDGYKVTAVSNGRDALAYLRSSAETCVVLLDSMTSTMESARFRAAQLRDRSLAWIPVVLMSGGVEAAENARAFGAGGFLRKPLDLDHVRRTLRTLGCGRAQSQHESDDNR
ncbi:MAG TPA: response regulator [Vicinamibacterales bacterium]|nr:response regulator [Vicinamibacterales bacterium]